MKLRVSHPNRPSRATPTARGPHRSIPSTSRQARAAATTMKTQQPVRPAPTCSRAVLARVRRAQSGATMARPCDPSRGRVTTDLQRWQAVPQKEEYVSVSTVPGTVVLLTPG